MYQQVQADLWTYAADWRVVTTNGFTRKDGTAVMGRGVASQARTKYPELERKLGQQLRATGNYVYVFPEYKIVTLPVKPTRGPDGTPGFMVAADPILIGESLVQLVRRNLDGVIAMPRPGCGNGKLDWATQVKPICDLVLKDDRYVVVDWEE